MNSFNEDTGEYEFQEVLNLFNYEEYDKLVEVTFDDGTSVTCTDTHKFLVDGVWVEAKDLNSKTVDDLPKVYDIEVSQNHNYVLSNGAIAHNSGKGFISEKLLGITGKTLDVDHLKGLVMASTKLAAKVKEETGHDMSKLNLRNPKDVALMHQLVADVYGVSKKNEATLFKSIAAAVAHAKALLVIDPETKE